MLQYLRMTTPYELARESYAAVGVDTEAALSRATAVPISIQCWQGDDVAGFETGTAALNGGIAATGNYPGRARNAEELRKDLEQALALIPGRHRMNLHASYAETAGARVERDALRIEHFRGWLDWASARGLGLDFNPTFFSHPLSADGFTLSHPDSKIRQFWIDHGRACRQIGAEFGRVLGSPCVTNVWIPDGYKDLPVDRQAPRERLAAALDEVFSESLPTEQLIDAVEPKLFGLGSESYVVGSHEFYLGYAITRGKALCLDAGHFHPTESVADKISSALLYVPRLLLHVSRGVRWDSDHVVIFDDATRAILEEVVRGGHLERVSLGLDFFDASINRVAAWVIGTRATQKALLAALLEPTARLRQYEREGDYTARLALLEETKTLPLGAVWDEFCKRNEVEPGFGWFDAVKRYECETLALRR
jgi:L-rhamnose isomerase